MERSTRRLLFADFLAAVTTVIVMVAAAAPLAPHVGIPAGVLRAAGLLLVPFVLFVLGAARSHSLPVGRLRFVVAFNLAWLVASLGLLALGDLSTFGACIIAGQALLVVPLIFFEARVLARSTRARA